MDSVGGLVFFGVTVCVLAVFFSVICTTHFDQVFALRVDGRQLHCLGGGRLHRLVCRWAGGADAGRRGVVGVRVVVVVAGVRVDVGVALSVAQLVELPGLLDQASAVVLALFPQRGRYALITGTVCEGGHLNRGEKYCLLKGSVHTFLSIPHGSNPIHSKKHWHAPPFSFTNDLALGHVQCSSTWRN